jgi:hypothetical protein
VLSNIPAGEYSIKISKAEYTTLETTGTIESTTDTQLTLDFVLGKLPKLVQITSNQTNYQLDTAYKYVSMLVVGRGGKVYVSSSDLDKFTGSGSGMIIYKKNFEISNFYEGQIDQIGFNKETFYGSKITGTSVVMSLDQTEDYAREICAQNALSTSGETYKGATIPHYYLGPTDLTSELDG